LAILAGGDHEAWGYGYAYTACDLGVIDAPDEVINDLAHERREVDVKRWGQVIEIVVYDRIVIA